MRLRRRTTAPILAAALVMVCVGLLGARPSADDQQDVAAMLRCPLCAGISVADSPSPMARDIRRDIALQLAAGRTPDEIRRKYVATYGEWILLTPPLRGPGLLAAGAPIVVGTAGLGVLLCTLRRWRVRGTNRGRER